jgi:hypothetical protein
MKILEIEIQRYLIVLYSYTDVVGVLEEMLCHTLVSDNVRSQASQNKVTANWWCVGHLLNLLQKVLFLRRKKDEVLDPKEKRLPAKAFDREWDAMFRRHFFEGFLNRRTSSAVHNSPVFGPFHLVSYGFFHSRGGETNR